MPIKDEIEVILKKRKEKSEVLEKRKESVNAFRSHLESLRTSLNRDTWNISNEEMRTQYTDIFRKIDTAEVAQATEKLNKVLDAAVSRFSRDFLSFATVGKERQGKSMLLQTIGGLDSETGNKVIPAFDAGSCTGAVSIIWNDPDVPRGEVRATISFRSQSDMVEIVKSYLRYFDPELSEYSQLRFDEIGNLNIDALRAMKQFGNARQSNAIKYLDKIVKHFHEICYLFNADPKMLTNPDEIQTYVAQNNGEPLESPARKEFIRYLAVARADIHCCFFSDVGNVRLVDTVGIGTTQTGAEKAMLDTVNEQCDAAIVVSRPEMAGIQEDDLDIYSLLQNEFQGREMELWLHYLVNKMTAPGHNNEKVVELFKKDIDDANLAIADCKIVNAADPQDVQKFLLQLLSSLMSNLERIDSTFMKDIEAAEKEYEKALVRFRRNLPAALPRIRKSVQGLDAEERGHEFYSHILSTDLSRIVRRWSEVKDETKNTTLWRNTQPILDSLDDFVPQPAEIQSILESNGNITPNALWELMLHNIRTAITDRFLQIDDELEQELREFKNSLVRSLYQELREITSDMSNSEVDEQSDMVEWLKSMMDTVLYGDTHYEQIRKGFEFLYEFQFNTRVQLIQLVRRQLYIINPICDEYAPPELDGGFTYANCGNEIHFYLTSRLAVIEDDLRYRLREIYAAPNMAFYAAAEEFYDRLIFASKREGGKLTDMRAVWGRFFQDFSEKLCTTDMDAYNYVNELIERYETMLDMVDEFISKSGNSERKSA